MITFVTIEPVSPAHAHSIQRLVVSDPAIIKLTRLPDPYPRNGAVTWTRRAQIRHKIGEEFSFIIVNEDELPVGVCGLVLSPDRQTAEIGYWIGRPHWGRGYATEGCRQVLKYAFEKEGLDQIFALALERNLASRRVLEKLGFSIRRLFKNRDPKWSPDELVVEYHIDRELYLTSRPIRISQPLSVRGSVPRRHAV